MRVVDILLLAREVSDSYEKQYGDIHANTYPIHIMENGIKQVVEKHTGLEIEVECLAWPGAMFGSRLDRYKNKSYIWYSDQLNKCWSRFYIAKELMHILCGKEKNFTTHLEPLILAIINRLPSNPAFEDEGNVLEYIAFYGAIELLLPEKIANDLYGLAKNLTNREIAKEFAVPEKIIDYRLSGEGRKFFDDFYKDVN